MLKYACNDTTLNELIWGVVDPFVSQLISISIVVDRFIFIFANVAQNFKNHIHHRKRHAKYMYNGLAVLLMHVHC